MIKFTLLLIGLFDYFHKKKIINFIKEDLKIKNIDQFFDIGGHRGETIDLFCQSFNINKIISFEASPKNFLVLNSKKKKFTKKFPNTKILFEELALGAKNDYVKIKEFEESSSNTIKEIDQSSAYFKKKFRFLNFFKKTNFFNETNVKLTKLCDYIEDNNIKNISFLKIDTEGSEFEILKGLEDKIKDVDLIYFEHHYDLMLKKNYNFSKMNNLLVQNNFKKIFKIKMPFRKVFEYIYINEKKK